MKKISIYIGFCAVLFSIASCKKFLEKNPDNRASLTTPKQVSQLLATAYPGGNYMAFCESSSDNVSDKGIGGQDRTLMDPFYFREVSDKDQDSPEYYFFSCYSAIAAANQALDHISKVPDPENYQAQKGEALVARAYSHFMLVTLFCKIYHPDSASNDMGIPYVTEPETVVMKQYDRKTVAYVYEMIEKDLLAGLPLLDDKTYEIPRYHFNRAAAHAFACRFYLFKRDWAKAISYANEVFSAGNIVSQLRPWNTTYRTMTYVELFADYAKATQPANLLLAETASWWGRNYYSQRYGVTTRTRDSILDFNPTGGDYAFLYQSYTAGTNNVLIPKVNEYFVRTSINAQIGVGYVMVPLFTTEEVLFNRAEAYIQQNNVTAALQDLNTYASTRIVNYNATSHRLTNTKLEEYYGTGNAQLNALLALLDFKRAEFIHEGMRWFDILRWHIPVAHVNMDRKVVAYLSEYDPRRVFQLPESVSTSGMPLNER
jgi:SusD family.